MTVISSRIKLEHELFDYTHDDQVDPPEDWQKKDIENLMNHPFSANWSQMGCKKTSTGLWLIQRQMRENKIEKPAILIITSKSGKGTFYQLAPHILEGYTLLTITAQGLAVVKDGKEIQTKYKEVPTVFDFPAIVLTNYDLFSYSNMSRFYVDNDGEVVTDQKGNPIMYEWKQSDYIMDRKWDFCWIDEAHRIKEREGRRAINIKKIKSPYKHLSTGTGFINRPAEIWSLLNFLNGPRYGGYWTFHNAFMQTVEEDGISYIRGIKPEMVEPFRRIVRDVGPRRTLREVMPHLKEPIQIIKEVELSKVQRQMYNEIKSELKAMDKNGSPIHSANVLSALQRLRQICVATPELTEDYFDEDKGKRIIKVKLNDPSSKLDAVQDILDDSDDDDLFVVFSCFKDPLELLAARLTERKNPKGEIKVPGVPFIHMKSTDTDEERYNKWAVEWPKREHKVFMSTLQLGGESINLTAANYIIFLDRSWSPKDNMQAIGRIDRPGQTQQPFIYNIEAVRTTDQRVFEVNEIKGSWFKTIFGNEE